MALATPANPITKLGAIFGGSGEGSGGMKAALVSITGDTAYPTGGSPNVTSTLEAAGLDVVNQIYALVPITQLGFEWDYLPTDRLKVYQQPAAAAAGASPEVPNNTNLSGLTIRCLVLYE